MRSANDVLPKIRSASLLVIIYLDINKRSKCFYRRTVKKAPDARRANPDEQRRTLAVHWSKSGEPTNQVDLFGRS